MSKKSSLFMILLIFFLFSLSSCNFTKDNDTDTVIDPPVTEDPIENEPVYDNSFYSIENLNYNADYKNASDGNEKGYLIYDDFDPNSVAPIEGKLRAKRYMIFSVYKNAVLMRTIKKESESTNYARYHLSEIGDYEIVVTGAGIQGNELTGKFVIHVIAGTRPDKFTFTVKQDETTVAADSLLGGKTYTVTTTITSNGSPYTIPAGSEYYWTPASADNLSYEFTIKNLLEDTSGSYNFYFHTNDGTKDIYIAKPFEYTAKTNLLKTTDNPEGIYYNYGLGETNGTATVNADFQHAVNDFPTCLLLEYRFDNGAKQAIPISTKKTDGEASVFIKYNDESEYSVYDANNYDYSKDYSGKPKLNYYSNGVQYRFNPIKESAELYIGICKRVLVDNYPVIVDTKISGTDLNLAFNNEKADSVSVTSVSGKHKNDTVAFANTYKSFSTTLTNDTLTVYVCCDMNGNNELTDEYAKKSQFFLPTIQINGGNLSDYTITYSSDNSNIEMCYSTNIDDSLDRYFVAPAVGSGRITITTCFGNVSYSFIVNVINKIFDSEKKVYAPSLEGKGLFISGKLKLDDFVRIQEYRLSDFTNRRYLLRKLNLNENLIYYEDAPVSSSIAKSATYFTSGDGDYKEYTISVGISGSEKKVSGISIVMLKAFTFSLNETSYNLATEEETTILSKTIDSAGNIKSLYFYGLLPKITVPALDSTTFLCDNVAITIAESGTEYYLRYNAVSLFDYSDYYNFILPFAYIYTE